MTKIAEIIDIFSGYASQVRLVEEFENPEDNRIRMERYVPIQAHRTAFRSLVQAIRPMGHRALLLTGSYGTGKSHLALMYANYMSLKSSEPEIDAFLKNWASAKPVEGIDLEAEAENLRNLRKDGRYLVALGNYGEGKDFDEMVLDAIQNAVRRDGIEELGVDTHYKEAIRRIEYWKEREAKGEPSGTYQDFVTELGRIEPGQSVSRLKKELSKNDASALVRFKEAYKAAVGEEFSYSKDNLIAILKDFLSSPIFQKRYRGLVIIADEFGYILDRGQINIDVFQRFAEMTRDGVQGKQLIFIGTGHKSFDMYAHGKMSASDFRVASDRVKEVPLASEEIEQIIGAIIKPKSSHPEWKWIVQTKDGLFTRLAGDAKRMKLFPHLDAAAIKEQIILDIFPMHPLATYSLVQMSKELGSNARSLFAFFTGGRDALEPSPGSFPQYVEETEIFDDERLSLFTADKLAEYFRDDIRPENSEAREAVRQHIRNYQASMEEARRVALAEGQDDVDAEVSKLLDLLLVLKISNLPTDAKTLENGFYCPTTPEKTRLRNLLKYLVEKKVLYLAHNSYEFKHSDAVDFESMIERYLSQDDHRPISLSSAVSEASEFKEMLEAFNHNQQFTEDKRFRRVFAEPGELEETYEGDAPGEEISYFEKLERIRNAEKEWDKSFDGTMVYVLCETQEDIARAKAAAKANREERVLVGIPRSPIPILESLMYLRAVKSIEEGDDFANLSAQDQLRYREDYRGDAGRKTGAYGKFIAVRDKYLDGLDLDWYGKKGSVHVKEPTNRYEPADELATKLFTKRNKVPHSKLNLSHPKRFGGRTDTALNDALEKLLATHRPIEIDKSAAEGRGEIRYLLKVLVQNGVLKQKQAFKGNVAIYEIDAPEKYQKMPALSDLLHRIRGLSDGETVRVQDLLQEFIEPPYGQGPAALSLFLGVAIRFFGDELLFKFSPSAMGYVEIKEPAGIYDMVMKKHPDAIIERSTIDKNKRELINEIVKTFFQNHESVTDDHAISEAFLAMKSWYENLPNISKAVDLYGSDSSAAELLGSLEGFSDLNPWQLLENVQSVYGVDPDASLTRAKVKLIVNGLSGDKQTIEDGPEKIKNALLRQLMEPFSPESDQYSHYQEAVLRWYSNLSEVQKDEHTSWYQDHQAAKTLMLSVRRMSDIKETFFVDVPSGAGFNLGKVDDWRRDRSAEYFELFEDAFRVIESHRVSVPKPDFEIQGEKSLKEGTAGYYVEFRGSVDLEVSSPESGVQVRVTDTGEDPRKAVQYEKVKRTRKIKIDENSQISLVCENSQGEFGDVIQIQFVNLDDRFRIRKSVGNMFDPDRWEFTFPPDKEAALIFLQSVVDELVGANVIGEEEGRKILEPFRDEENGAK